MIDVSDIISDEKCYIIDGFVNNGNGSFQQVVA